MAAAKMQTVGDEESLKAFDTVFDPVLDKQNRTSNEVLAVLLSFYFGEYPDEDLTCELIARGKSVLPALRKFRNREIVISKQFRSAPSEVNAAKYDWVIEQIESGEWCNRQP